MPPAAVTAALSGDNFELVWSPPIVAGCLRVIESDPAHTLAATKASSASSEGGLAM